MRVIAPAFLTTILVGVCLAAQSTGAPPSGPAYEVVSVKPNESGSFSSSSNTRGGSFTATNATVRQLVLTAYRLRDFQVSGGPGWIESDRFDVAARAPEGEKPDHPAMLRTLLAERFTLRTHRETREQPIYALVVARSDGRLGPQLQPSTIDCSGRGGAPPAGNANCGLNSSVGGALGKMTGTGTTMDNLATALGNFGLNRMVLNRTGLTGGYDVELQWMPDNARAPAGDTANQAPSIFTALQEQLGLKLDSQRGPVEFLVIDSVDQPTPD
jgi:uncharacterized protein (TIGR03435 family)